MPVGSLLLLLSVTARAAIVAIAPTAYSALPVAPAASVGTAPSALPETAVLPPYLSVADPVDAAFLAGVVAEAQASPTARAVLARVERAAAVRGRPLVVEVLAMKESGTYNLDWGIVSLRRSDVAEGAKANVPTIIHEMLHLLQADELKVPSDLLETELEAYMTDFKVHRELELKPRRGSYDARAQAAFKKGFEPFMRFLAKEYPEDAAFWKTRSSAYEARLKKGLEETNAERAEVEAQKAERLRTLARMQELGHPEAELKAYKADSVDPLDAALETLDRAVKYALEDLAVFASPETLAKARAYARDVVRKARAYQKTFARR